MQLSETIKLKMTKAQKTLVIAVMNEYINTVNRLVSDVFDSDKSINKYTSANVKANLPSALKNQCIRDAKSIVKKHNKTVRKMNDRSLSVPVLKRPCCYINNQNFNIKGKHIEFPVIIDKKSKRISVQTTITNRQIELFANAKIGTMRIVRKGHKIVAQIVYETVGSDLSDSHNVMGVDLGVKCPAVSYCSDGSVKFHGNGRKNKYIRRHYKSLRRKLQKAKRMKAVKRIKNKEQRIMKDINHKLSRNIINAALAHKVSVIKLERLNNIRSTTRTSRKNNHSLHNWSFYRLSKYIEYKAKIAGIEVEYVNPAYTSQKCPKCGHIHHANDRHYSCKCGYHTHRDLLGAINICNSTEYVGDISIRHTA